MHLLIQQYLIFNNTPIFQHPVSERRVMYIYTLNATEIPMDYVGLRASNYPSQPFFHHSSYRQLSAASFSPEAFHA